MSSITLFSTLPAEIMHPIMQDLMVDPQTSKVIYCISKTFTEEFNRALKSITTRYKAVQLKTLYDNNGIKHASHDIALKIYVTLYHVAQEKGIGQIFHWDTQQQYSLQLDPSLDQKQLDPSQQTANYYDLKIDSFKQLIIAIGTEIATWNLDGTFHRKWKFKQKISSFETIPNSQYFAFKIFGGMIKLVNSEVKLNQKQISPDLITRPRNSSDFLHYDKTRSLLCDYFIRDRNFNRINFYNHILEYNGNFIDENKNHPFKFIDYNTAINLAGKTIVYNQKNGLLFLTHTDFINTSKILIYELKDLDNLFKNILTIELQESEKILELIYDENTEHLIGIHAHSLTIWDCKTLQKLKYFEPIKQEGISYNISTCLYVPSRQMLITAGSADTTSCIHIWDLEKTKLIRSIPLKTHDSIKEISYDLEKGQIYVTQSHFRTQTSTLSCIEFL